MEKKTRKRSKLVTNIVISIIIIFVIGIAWYGIKRCFVKIQAKQEEKERQHQAELAEDNTILYKISNGNSFKYINQYGYITTYEDDSAVEIQENEITEYRNQLSEKLMSSLSTLVTTLESNNLLDKVSKIDVSDLENIKLYMDSEEKIVELGNINNLTTKIKYIEKIMEQEKGNAGTILVNGDITNEGAKFKKRI